MKSCSGQELDKSQFCTCNLPCWDYEAQRPTSSCSSAILTLACSSLYVDSFLNANKCCACRTLYRCSSFHLQGEADHAVRSKVLLCGRLDKCEEMVFIRRKSAQYDKALISTETICWQITQVLPGSTTCVMPLVSTARNSESGVKSVWTSNRCFHSASSCMHPSMQPKTSVTTWHLLAL